MIILLFLSKLMAVGYMIYWQTSVEIFLIDRETK